MKSHVIYLMAVAFALSAVFTTCKKDPKKEKRTVPITGEVVINGVHWATCNVGAHGQFVAKPEDYGGLYQWGRRGDGHESRTSFSYPTNDDSPENGVIDTTELDADGQIPNTHAAYSKFVKAYSPWDWRTPKADTLWNSGTESSPIKTVNDPCPCGWRVPTAEEFKSLLYEQSEEGELNGIFGRFFGSGENSIFLPAAGIRDFTRGSLYCDSLFGCYWSSSPSSYSSSTGAYNFISTSAWYMAGDDSRSSGKSVRCVAEHK